MSLGVNRINFTAAEQPRPSQVTTAGGASNTQLLKQNGSQDTVCFKGTGTNSDKMTDSEKKEMIRAARSKAAGYAIFGGLFSTLYYGLRSDKKVAEKFNLDPVEDKSLIKKIKTQQLIWTLPASIPGVGLVTGLAGWLYNKNMDPEGIEL